MPIFKQSKTDIVEIKEIEETKMLRKKLLFVFPIKWWETVSSKHIANDIQISTDHQIRHIYLNGKLLKQR